VVDKVSDSAPGRGLDSPWSSGGHIDVEELAFDFLISHNAMASGGPGPPQGNFFPSQFTKKAEWKETVRGCAIFWSCALEKPGPPS